MSAVADDETVGNLESAASAYERARERVEEFGESELRELAEVLRRARRIVESYGERAVGTGDFEAYVRLQEEIASLIESLTEDLPGRDHFEAIDETLDRRTLRERDLERVREHLRDAETLTERIEALERARSDLRDARRRARARLEELEERIGDLERVEDLHDVDREAGLETIREPIERYDEAILAAVERARREDSARSVLERLDRARHYPLLDVRPPPADLETYLQTAPIGEEPIVRVLELAGYSRSKLAHHVSDPETFERRIATREPYLDSIDGAPLTVGWPPPPAAELRWTARSIRAIAASFASTDTIATLRTVRRLSLRDDYERLRAGAVAEAELDAAQRDRLGRGALGTDLQREREERSRIADALEAAPDP